VSVISLGTSNISRGAIAFVLLLAILSGLLASFSDAPRIPIAVAFAAALVILIAVIPVAGAYLWLLAAPLIVGVVRGQGVFTLRPSEALLAIIAAGIGLHCLWLFSRGERYRPPICGVDIAIVLLVITGSIVPLLLRYRRGLPLSQDDILYALVFLKYFVLYAMFRLAVQTPAQVAICLRLALASSAVVAIIAALQVSGLFGLPEFLNAHYDHDEGAGPHTLRGSSTIASPFGLADVMALRNNDLMGHLQLP
jgi:hypothetical protein